MIRVGKSLDSEKRFSPLGVVFLVLVFMLVTFSVYSLITTNSSSTTAASTNSTTTAVSGTNAYAILKPASVPSKTAECSQTVTFSSDGDSGPVSCSNGDLNVLEWQALSALEPKVLTLGYGASESEVESTLCSDVSANISNVLETTSYQIAALYYGWNFSSDPSAVLSSGSCQNSDD